LINADVEANCVTVHLSIVHTLWHQVKGLIEDHNVSTAKELLEWIGIVGGIGSVTLGGVKIGQGGMALR
jgi:hypothetical protein